MSVSAAPRLAGGWDEAYAGPIPALWDTGRPQQAFYRLASTGRLHGRVLDAGCGNGENTLMAAAWGCEAVGADISPRAVTQAREKAAVRGLAARFEVADVLSLAGLGTFRTVLDAGMFHCFSDADRMRYARSLASVLEPNGTLWLLCYADRQPGTWGPRRIRQADLLRTFTGGWLVEQIQPAMIEATPNMGAPAAYAWLATITRR